jgi:hypothetical protein
MAFFRAAPSFMTTTTRSTGSVAKLAGQAEDHLRRLRYHQQGLLRRRSGPSLCILLVITYSVFRLAARRTVLCG